MKKQQILFGVLALMALIGAVLILMPQDRKPAPVESSIHIDDSPEQRPTRSLSVGTDRIDAPKPQNASTVMEVAPEVELPVEPAAYIPPSDQFTTPSARLHILVVEEGTREPLESVTVRLGRNNEEPVEYTTNSKGVVYLQGIAPGAYGVSLQWGRHNEITVEPAQVKEGERTVKAYEYPARQKFAFRLLTEEEQPVAYHELKVGLPLSRWGRGDEGMVYENVRTNASGEFTVRAYEDSRPIHIASDEAELFSTRRSRGWSNPHYYAGRLEQNETTDVYMRGNVVIATGILVNAPQAGDGPGYVASVRSESTNYWAIRVENNRFNFTAVPGETARVTLTRQSEPGMRWAGLSREKMVSVDLPDEPGEFEFEIPFEERQTLHGRVFLPSGDPAEGIRFVAMGFNAAEGGGENNAGERGRGRGRGGWGGGGGGSTSFMSEGSNSSGHFTIELPPATEYLVQPSIGTLPDDAKGHEPITVPWQDIVDGREVVFFLETSSLVWGEVVDEGGKPVPNMIVTLHGEEVDFASIAYRAQTDEEGFFEMNVPPIEGAQNMETISAGLYVRAWGNTHAGLAQTALNSETPVTVVVHERIDGVFQVTQNGAPVQEVEMYTFFEADGFRTNAGRRRQREGSNEEGAYAFRSEPRGITVYAFTLPGRPGNEAVMVKIPPDAKNGVVIPVDLSQ